MGISDERKVATIANDETTILGRKATIAVQIPIKFCVSHAMTAKKSAKKCTAFRVFVLIKLLLLYLFFFFLRRRRGCSSSPGALRRKTKRRFDEKRATKKTSAGTHREDHCY